MHYFLSVLIEINVRKLQLSVRVDRNWCLKSAIFLMVPCGWNKYTLVN